MKSTGVINKIIITAEAVFDYEESLGLGRLDRRTVKAEVEEYVNLKNKGDRLLYDNYFRCKYFDEVSERMLMLFVYRTDKISVMQNWRLVGICFAEDWSEDVEYAGIVRGWVENIITDLGKDDWVVEMQIRAAANEVMCGWSVSGTIKRLPKEVISAIEYGSNQGLVEAVSVFQNAVGKRTWREHFDRKASISRKINKRAKRGGL